jgi:hypothetical protein
MDRSITLVVRFLFLGFLTIAATGCAISPLDQAQLPFNQKVTFSLYVLDNATDIKLQCTSPLNGGGWGTFKTINPDDTPFNINGTTVYLAQTKVNPVICWQSEGGNAFSTNMRFKQGGVYLFVFDQNGINCFNNKLKQGQSGKDATLACALKKPNGDYATSIKVWTDAGL